MPQVNYMHWKSANHSVSILNFEEKWPTQSHALPV